MTNTNLNSDFNPNSPENLPFSYENFEKLKEILERKDEIIKGLKTAYCDTLRLFDFESSAYIPVDKMKTLPVAKDFFIEIVKDHVILTGLN